MNRILALQFAFDWMIYDVHKVDYNPIKDIEAFWNHYALETVSANILQLLSTYLDGGLGENRLLKDEEMQEFATALYRVLIAYCIVNHRNIDLRKMQLSAEAEERIGKELELSKKVAEFFSRLSK
ncbi:Uncharacterised protein [Sphingobacterium multivorum]|uniref:hypothetical protein n=1 Tax=Sphingobacterium TaxID=28453 RepID=UPI000969ED4C|nr:MULTISPECIES: hypothetical protein [Sphingobacterium]OJZ04545.1 MAG: hypothetical protein BGP15_07635 [Sphingobacterium sp. 40-24]QQT47166.1 hypothetical protein I6J00_11120 [Sphingobacterium multivorum]SUJ13760.1 Uncharacterised protein [Sphingobacterium multivorum]